MVFEEQGLIPCVWYLVRADSFKFTFRALYRMDIWVSPALHIMNEIAVAGSTTNARDEPAVVAGQNAGV